MTKTVHPNCEHFLFSPNCVSDYIQIYEKKTCCHLRF